MRRHVSSMAEMGTERITISEATASSKLDAPASPSSRDVVLVQIRGVRCWRWS